MTISAIYETEYDIATEAVASATTSSEDLFKTTATRITQSWKFLAFLIATLLAYIYIRYTQTFPAETQILQTSLEAFHPRLFSEKQPIVIDDPIYSYTTIFPQLVRWRYLISSTISPTAPTPTSFITKSAHTIFHNPTEETQTLKIAHPRNRSLATYQQAPLRRTLYAAYLTLENGIPEEEPSIIMKLHAHQTLLLPPQWIVSVQAPLVVYAYTDLSHMVANTILKI